MSRMLTLIDAGWESVRSSAGHGRPADALARASRLLARPDLPTPVAAEAHRLVGELQTDAERYSEARHHLRAAAVLEPACARTFYLWGLAHERDPQACDRQATLCFRRARKLEPANPLYRAAFGRAAVRCDNVKLGVRELLATAEDAPGDAAVIRVVVEGLLEAGKIKAARRVLTKARFLCSGSGKGGELVGLSERIRFEAARSGQRKATRHGQDAELATDGGRVVLQFVRLATPGSTKGLPGEATRLDVVSLPRPHFPRLRVGRVDR